MMAQLKQIDLINQSLITLHCHLIYFPIFERLLKLFLIIACFDCTVLISGLQIFFNPRIFHLDIVQFYLMLGIDASFETLLVFYLLPLFYHLLRYSSLTYGYVQSHLQQNYIFFLTWLIFRFILDWGIGFLYFYWLIYEFAAQYYQLFMKNNEDQSHNFEVIFLQGIHFYHLNNYYTNLINYLSIFTFIGIDMHIKKTINSTIKSQKNIYQVTSKNLVGRLFVIENRLVRNDLVQYWFVNTLQEFIEGQKNHCQIMIKSEIQMGKNPKDNRNIIKAIIHYSQSIFRFSIFEGFNKLRYKSVLFKDNYCQNYRYNQIVYPYPRINDEYSQNTDKSPIILLLNQNNLRQIPFFQNLLINLSKAGTKIDKIIGHPSSLFLCFLYDENKEINSNIAKILLNYDRQTQYRQTFSNKIQKSKIIKGLLLKTLTQQNIINPSLVQFIVDNIVNQQFIQDFITLIQLYYKIFLQIEVSKSQIESMFSNFFYEQQLTIQRQCFKFSSLLHHIEFKHNIWVNQLIKRIIHHLPSKFTQIQQITLKDLYDHCQIEFTFVALDLTDKIVRFFNHITTPKMPIIAILSLIQFLPLPYKSIYWRSQWGPYKVSYPKYRKQIDITNHQIIDSRFLLETPLDLIQDKHLRNCYMQNTNKSYVIRAVSSIRKKAQQLQEIQTLKALLKSMKSNAIDSIPKLRLIWKILTTNNRVQFDINDVQSFSQIPILSRIIKLDQTFKVYLQNINKEVNQDRIIKIPAMLFPQRNINLPIVEQNLRKLIQIINSFIKSQKQGNNNAQQEIKIKQIQFLLEGTRLKYLQQWIYLLNHINNKITNIFLSKNQQIVKKIGQITSEFYHYQQFLDSKQVQMHFRQLITLIKQSKPNKQAMDAPLQSLNSSTFLRDNQFQFQNNAHKIKSLQVIIRSINQQLNSYKYRRNQSSQLLLMQYQKHMFQWSHKLVQIIQKMPQTSSTHKFLVQAFRVTPWIYKITQVKNKKIVHQCTLMSKFQKTNHSLHLILNGQSNTQFQIINLIHRLNNCLGQGKISKITATNFHSVVALLFVINLDQFSIMEEVIGLWHLVAKSTVKNDKKQQNINDLLLKRQNRKIACQQNDQLFINVAKKFPNAFKLLLLIEQKSKQAQTIDIDQIYIIIDEYDRQNPQLLFQQKQQQIISFLQVLQLRQSQIFDKINLINMNESMIQEKMKLNKVGIKFLIRFMYRNMEYQENWFKIHTQTFRKTQLLHNHLLKIFDKYKINDTITLNQFNLTNKLKIQLNFILSNYESKSYDIFNSSNKGQAKLIDLIVSSITIPIQFGPQPIQLKQLQAQQKINILLNKKNHKMVSNNIQNLYWSNYGSNPSPFNLIQGQQQQQICISFDLTHINPQRQGQNQRQSLRSSKDSIKNKIEQTQNLKTIDLLSMWWTKSKKLTPEMKQILFGAIFQSPFLEYYYFVQNNSYEHLLKKRELRFLVDISNKKQQQLSKSEVISSIVSSQQQNILGVIKINLKLGLLQSVEGIYMSSACEMKVHGLQNYLSDGVTYKMARPTAKLKIFLYKLSEQSLDVFQMSIQLSQKPLSSSYLKFKLIDTDKIQITSSLNQQQVVKFQLIHNRIDYLECKTCKRCTLVSKQQACIFCTEPKEKRGHLNMYLLAHFSYKQEFQEHKSKIIEEVRQSIILSQIKEPLKDQSSFFNMCCCFCQAKQDSLPIQK